MGAACTGGPQVEPIFDKITIENMKIDAFEFPRPNCPKLQYLNDFQNKFNVLKFFQLVDFVNLLNNFRPDSNGENSAHSLKFRDTKIYKNDWMRFINNKILTSPLIPELDVTAIGLQSGFYDDVFDKLLKNNNYFLDGTEKFVPKLCVLAFAFNYCGMKLSQKIEILFNFFAVDGKVSQSNDMYAFLYTIISFAYYMPAKFLTKFQKEDHNAKYYGVEVEKDSNPIMVFEDEEKNKEDMFE